MVNTISPHPVMTTRLTVSRDFAQDASTFRVPATAGPMTSFSGSSDATSTGDAAWKT